MNRFQARPGFATALLVVAGLALGPGPSGAQAPKRDERVALFPSTARSLADGRIEARVEAWVYEHERRPGAAALLAQWIGLDLSELAPAERARYEARTQLFRIDSEGGHVLRRWGASAPARDRAGRPGERDGRASGAHRWCRSPALARKRRGDGRGRPTQVHGFPVGTMHLRSVSISQEIFGAGGTRAHKLAAIGQLLDDFPRRRFVLVGDSGEQDPEIYGELARAHPDRIVAILIRDAAGQPADSPRFAEAMRGIPRERWRLFADPAGLRDRF